MKAGRELDALVAEKVMGFIAYKVQLVAPPPRVRTMDELQHIGEPLPHYSTNIADAWEVVPVLDQRLDQFWSVVRAGEKFEFYSNPYELGDYTAYVEADTLPLLLCLAALKAKGVTGEQHG